MFNNNRISNYLSFRLNKVNLINTNNIELNYNHPTLEKNYCNQHL